MKENAKKVLLLLLVVALNSAGYKAAQVFRPTGTLLAIWIDSSIPYISYFVVPYALYVFVVLLAFVVCWKDYKLYKTMALSMATAIAIAIVIYMTFQTAVVRTNIEGTDIFNQGVKIVYQIDAPLNSFPSLHVAIPTIATMFIFLRNKKIGLATTPIAILIILSTVFIKQHVVLDVLGGLALSLCIFRFRKAYERIKV